MILLGDQEAGLLMGLIEGPLTSCLTDQAALARACSAPASPPDGAPTQQENVIFLRSCQKNFFFLVEVYLIYKIVSLSSVLQTDVAMHTDII